MQTIKIILVDDHQIVRDGISARLLLHTDIELLAEASCGTQLFDLLKVHSPDVVVLDVAMPDMTGVEICEILKKDRPEIKVVIFTGDQHKQVIFDALDADADAFIPKETSTKELIDAIYAVMNNEHYISSLVPAELMKEYANKDNNQEIKTVKKTILSEREIEVLKLIADGKSYKEIADQLFISDKTVEKHKRNIRQKLKLNNTIELVKYAIKNNLVKL